jgi:hypothetical protein
LYLNEFNGKTIKNISMKIGQHWDELHIEFTDSSKIQLITGDGAGGSYFSGKATKFIEEEIERG